MHCLEPEKAKTMFVKRISILAGVVVLSLFALIILKGMS